MSSRTLPSRSCKTKISYEDKNSSDDESQKEANLNESAKNSTQNKVNDTTEENDEKKQDSTNVWNEQIYEKFSEYKSLKAKWENDMKKACVHSLPYFEGRQEMIQHFMDNWSSSKSKELLTFIDDFFQHLTRHLAICGISSINRNTNWNFSILQQTSSNSDD